MVVTLRPLGIQLRYESYGFYYGRAESRKDNLVLILFPFADYLNSPTKQAEIFMVTIDIMMHYNLHGSTKFKSQIKYAIQFKKKSHPSQNGI